MTELEDDPEREPLTKCPWSKLRSLPRLLRSAIPNFFVFFLNPHLFSCVADHMVEKSSHP